MILITEFCLELDLNILAFLDIKPVMNVLLLCKFNYYTFHNYLLKNKYPEFYFTDTIPFHRAIIFNKYNIVKWLIVNCILKNDHRVLCQYYKKNYELSCFPCFHQEYIDITLSLAIMFADDKLYTLLIKNNNIKPITNSLKFNYIEHLITEQKRDYNKTLLTLTHSYSNPSKSPIKHILNRKSCEYLQFFLDALDKYRLTNYWDLHIKIYPCSDTS